MYKSSSSSDYSISCSGPDQTVRTILDIPERCRSTDVYCATLAHKVSILLYVYCPENINHFTFGGISVCLPKRSSFLIVGCCKLFQICHSFCPNATYSNAFHPRFGNIRCAVSLRKIYAGEEIWFQFNKIFLFCNSEMFFSYFDLV